MFQMSRIGAAMQNRPAIDELMKFVMPVPETGCWIWTGEMLNEYGRINVDGEDIKADIASWETRHGRLPDGQRLQHKCRIKCCINPEHLVPIAR